MKSFDDLRYELNENRLLRKGVATVFAAKSRSEGNKVERHLASAKNALRHRPNDNTEEQVRRLQEGLIDMCDANIALRKQLGAVTAIVLSSQLMNERTNRQVEKLLGKKR
ncbi:hypothetical protein N9X59_02890 [Alphaproteobacteria bacterium]|nr:hypothetical protein [Alphaproteobacteria bacterium]